MASKSKFSTWCLSQMGIALLSVLAQSQFSSAADEKKEKPYLATCPVKGMSIDESFSAEYKGKKIFFCCPLCPDEFSSDPEPYLVKAHIQLLGTKQIAQVACPVSGHDLDPDHTLKIGDHTVTFCCPACVFGLKRLRLDAKNKKVFQNLSKAFTFQTKCPVTDKPILAQHVVEHNKRKVYFASADAAKEFQKSPEKFLKKLPPAQKSAKKE